MRKPVQKIVLTAVLSVIAMSAQAQMVTPGFHFVLNAGITGGGDTIASVQYVGGGSADIKAGGTFQFGGGGLWQFSNVPLAAQVTVNYHIDDMTASNGSGSFSRVPIETTLFYTGVPSWRFGIGARFNQSPEYELDVPGTRESATFDSSTGVLVEIGYGITQHSWVNFRMVSEKYKTSSYQLNGTSYNVSNTPALDGSHVGISYVHIF